jgi:ribonucleoside-diphosphate reductase beta chain
VARDESRHVNFGVRFLKEMVERDHDNAQVIRGTIMRALPVALTVIEPPGGDMTYFDPLPYGPDDLTAFAYNSLEKRLRVIGVELAA